MLTLSNHVSTESLYATNLSFVLPQDWSANLDITRPSVVNDLKNKNEFNVSIIQYLHKTKLFL